MGIALETERILEPTDDVAFQKLGEGWRIPTIEEYNELIDKCTWEWSIENGHFGYKIIGKNGNSIFLPCAGYKEGNFRKGAGRIGKYWSSTLYVNNPYPYKETLPSKAQCLYFNTDGIIGNSTNKYSFDEERYRGLTIRPVQEIGK